LKVEFDSIKEQISALEDQLATGKNLDDDLAEFAAFSIKYLANLKDKWWELDWEEKQQCENLLFPEGIFIDESGRLSHPSISAVLTLAEPNSNKKELDYSSNSLLVELRGIAPRSVRLLASALQA
jgi:hypothetical protein